MFRRTLNGWGYSPLAQITDRNVGGLQPGLVPRRCPSGSYEGTPIVHDGVMYIIAANDQIQAVDAATGDLIWNFKRRYAEGYKGGGSKRNIAIFENLIINTSADGFAYAVDIHTGKQAWETKVTDFKTQSASTSAARSSPDGKVISGRNCARDAGPDACVMVANDARTGKELWRTHTIPKPGEPGDETWGDVPWEKRLQVGTWMAPSYDPELNLIYFGTSVTAPTTKYLLAGNDKKHLYYDLDPGAGRQHRQDRLALPAHHRPLGLRPHLRAHAGRHRRSRPIPRRCRGSTPRSSQASGARC